MARNAYWTNSDGLVVGFGTRTVDTGLAAKVSTGGEYQELVMDIVGADLEDTGIPTAFQTGAYVPANSLIVSALLIVDTAFVGATATLDIGTYTSAGAAIDVDGLHAAVAVASLTADTDIAGAGAQIGAVVTQEAYIAATYNTAAFTAGTAKLIVRYIKQ